MTEPPDLAVVKRLLPLVERALAAEGCPPDVRRRVMNTLIFGHPDGPDARETVALREARLQPDADLLMPAPACIPPHPQDLLDDTARFVCPRCGAISVHPDDVAAGYCGACHDWTGAPGVTP